MSDKPVIRVDFGIGNLKERLPRLAYEALVRADLPTRGLANELRGYGRAKRLDDQRPSAIMRIVSRFVTVYPTDYMDMIIVLGRFEASRYFTGVNPPEKTWEVMDLLRAENPRLAQEFHDEVARMIESGIQSIQRYWTVINLYQYDKRGLRPKPRSVQTLSHRPSTVKAPVRLTG